ncbi:hypothetical protein C4J81_12640 [Deltaproteobacteria bacterium Smac51]|nr:hypothetical protein C4J81_12640 [Deltaproteobacteria bacterium Smac51]
MMVENIIKHIKLLRVVMPLVILLFSAAPVMADQTNPAVRSAVDAAAAEVITLLNQRKPAEAYELAMRLFRQDPEQDAVVYVLARAANASGRRNQAVMAYELLLEKYPRTLRLHVELHKVYVDLGDVKSAAKVADTIRALGGEAAVPKAAVEEDPLRVIVHGRFRFGGIYDSNANQGPGSNILDLGAWRVRVDDAKSKETAAAYLGANLDFSKRTRIDGPAWLVADLHTYIRGNFNNDLATTRSRYSQWLRGAVGMRYLTSDSLLDFRFKAEIFDYEFFQHVSSLGAELTHVKALSPAWRLTTRGDFARRDYSRSPGYNGLYYGLGQYLGYTFENGNQIIAGVRYNGASAKVKNYCYNGWEESLRLVFTLPYKTELSPFATYSEDKYQGPATALEKDNRRDRKWRMGASLTHRLNESWSTELLYQYTTNKSNSGLYIYDQTMVSLGLAYSF